MSTPAITVKGLTKAFRLARTQKGPGRYLTLRDSIASSFRNLAYRDNEAVADEYKALDNVNLEIDQGEKVGIIGRNGAGKSTLLKILSRIIEPTAGEIKIRGRVASLLEVGTGFHPELTGRENIFFNGSLLGMTRNEIQRSFDDIVAFSEVEQFLDTPVKHYSSGMYVRLGFAVAAHLQTEVLIVDEVLAVGDMKFQNKCLGRLREIGQQGRTVLFVSHNMSSVLQFTDRAVVLDQGRISFDGSSDEAVSVYMQKNAATTTTHEISTFVDWFRITKLTLERDSSSTQFNAPLEFKLCLDLDKRTPTLIVTVSVMNSIGSIITTSRAVINDLETGDQTHLIRIKDHRLIPGAYSIKIMLWGDNRLIADKEQALFFDVIYDDIEDPHLFQMAMKARDHWGSYSKMLISKT